MHELEYEQRFHTKLKETITSTDQNFLLHYNQNLMTNHFITIVIDTQAESLSVIKHDGSYKEPTATDTISWATFPSSKVSRQRFIS